jgi:hypothetical protein
MRRNRIYRRSMRFLKFVTMLFIATMTLQIFSLHLIIGAPLDGRGFSLAQSRYYP